MTIPYGTGFPNLRALDYAFDLRRLQGLAGYALVVAPDEASFMLAPVAPGGGGGGGGSGTTNLGLANLTTSTLDITSSTGTSATLPAATLSVAGLLTVAQLGRLNSALQTAQLGVTVAPLDGNQKLPLANIPASLFSGAYNGGSFNPATGVTSGGPNGVGMGSSTLGPAPVGNQANFHWIASGPGTFNSVAYKAGDWIVADNGAWTAVPTNDSVASVYGRLGAVIAVLGDYQASLITNDSSVAGAAVSDALDMLLAMFSAVKTPKTVSASRPLDDSDHGYVLRCTTALTLTNPTTLRADFRCVVLPTTSSTVTVTSTGANTNTENFAFINGGFGPVKSNDRASAMEIFPGTVAGRILVSGDIVP